MSCESWESNAQYDIVPMPQPGDHLNPIACYLGEHMEKYLTHPYASPLFGDFKGLPPLLIQAGEVEVLRDEITLLAHKATLAGVEVRHELYEDMVGRSYSWCTTRTYHTLPGPRISITPLPGCCQTRLHILPRLRMVLSPAIPESHAAIPRHVCREGPRGRDRQRCGTRSPWGRDRNWRRSRSNLSVSEEQTRQRQLPPETPFHLPDAHPPRR